MSRADDIKTFDALYGDVQFAEHTSDLIRRPLVQRLRHVRLSNIDSLQMPGIANISRFEHALGTAYLATQVGFINELSRDERIELEAAALIHDSAITPFGHLTEEALQYVQCEFDHETKWAVLSSGGEHPDPGGMDVQIFLGRPSGLNEWATKVFAGAGPKRLGEILNAIQGRGRLGPCIAGSLDLDNLDNVVRIALHMGLRPDPSLPVRICNAMIEINSLGEIIFRHEALSQIGQWISLREQVYGRLMTSPIDFCGKLMLIYATVSAYKAGVVSETDWHLTDHEFVDLLLNCSNSSASEATKRWVLGDAWDLAELIWMRGTEPAFSLLEAFSAEASERLNRRCFAYRIKDKRKRKITALLQSGDKIIVGESSDRWLLGVGSPDRKVFTANDNRLISDFAAEYFKSQRVHASSVEAALF
jgi:uncharacterized protein